MLGGILVLIPLFFGIFSKTNTLFPLITRASANLTSKLQGAALIGGFPVKEEGVKVRRVIHMKFQNIILPLSK